MKKDILKQLTTNFIYVFKREPNTKEKQNLDFVAFQYAKDMKNILREEIYVMQKDTKS